MQLILSKAILVVITHLLLILPSSSTATTTSHQSKRGGICHEQANGVFLPMQANCAGFYMCLDGVAIASSCGSYYKFNAATGVCEHPQLVKCNNEATNMGHAEDHYAWVMPMLPVKPTIDDLPPPPPPPGFPAHLPKPQSPEEVDYDEAAGDICAYQRNGVLLPKADSCAHFYVCLLRRPYRRTCPPMLHFNAERRLCQAPDLAKCKTRPFHNALALELAEFEEDGSWSCAKMPDGIQLPHDRSCEKFFNCQQGQPLEMACPEGLHFSLRHQRCELPALARCSFS